MLISERSLVENLDGAAGNKRRGCRLFIPQQRMFTRDQLLLAQCSATRYRVVAPPATTRPLVCRGSLSSGARTGWTPLPRCVRPCWSPASSAAGPIGGPSARQRWQSCRRCASSTRQCAEPNAAGLDASPTAWAAPNSLAAVVAALAAVAVLPAVKSLDSMLIGVDANFSGVLSSFSIDIARRRGRRRRRRAGRGGCDTVQAVRGRQPLQRLRHSGNRLRSRRHQRLDAGSAGRTRD